MGREVKGVGGVGGVGGRQDRKWRRVAVPPLSLRAQSRASRGLTLCPGDGRSLLCPVCVSADHLFLLMPLLEKKDILENRIGTSV